MPNRILKESICMSDNLALVSAEAERLFYRLIVKCDDYGIYYGHEQIIKNTCFAANADQIPTDQIIKNLAELEIANLIERYEVNGKQYIHISTWHDHQKIRNKNPKYPLPAWVMPDASTDYEIKQNQLSSSEYKRKQAVSNDVERRQLIPVADNCEQLHTNEDNSLKSNKSSDDVTKSTIECNCGQMQTSGNNCEQLRPYSYSESYSGMGTESGTESNSENCSAEISYLFFGEIKTVRELSEFVKDVIFYLNFKAGKSFSISDPVCTQYAKERLSEGFTAQDFFTIIAKKATEWGRSNTMNRYLQPSTLFSAKNFKNYRDQQTRVDVLPDYMEREKAGLPPLEEER